MKFILIHVKTGYFAKGWYIYKHLHQAEHRKQITLTLKRQFEVKPAVQSRQYGHYYITVT